jgi:glucosamine--fructose-6-phosphate aminotransferase (isomerizing)
MCGILGYIGDRNAPEVLLEGLKRLEYRGYDSAGVAVLSNSHIEIKRSVGKLSGLAALLKGEPLSGTLGIGHTRWATHGVPSEDNAHPHTDCRGRIVVVHNGIIENYRAIKEKLSKEGHVFRSQTDTEVVAHLIEKCWGQSDGAGEARFLASVRSALKVLEGAYALAILCAEVPHILIAARRDCPLVIGVGEGESFLASDVPAILSYTRRIVFLQEGEIAILDKKGYRLLEAASGALVNRAPESIQWNAVQAEKAGYKHFMLKEIFEQPRCVEDTLRGRLNWGGVGAELEDANLTPGSVRGIERVLFVACGTSYHASLVGKFLLESFARMRCEVDIASEFRYRDPLVDDRTLVIAISQSGETADTLAAVRLAKARGARTLSICNGVGSTMAREAGGVFLTHCGPEIGVASTKAFMGQLTALYLLALFFAGVKDSVPKDRIGALQEGLIKLPRWIEEAVGLDAQIASLAQKFFRSSNFLYLGRHINYPIALEGALKLKEISYIHAEGYPAGEMKHGPIALIDENMPLVMIATRSGVYDKVLSNIQEVRARGGRVIAVGARGDENLAKTADHVLGVPDVPEILSPAVNVVPLQLLAYHMAVLKGCDVDQPRNLAKSVTVE